MIPPLPGDGGIDDPGAASLAAGQDGDTQKQNQQHAVKLSTDADESGLGPGDAVPGPTSADDAALIAAVTAAAAAVSANASTSQVLMTGIEAIAGSQPHEDTQSLGLTTGAAMAISDEDQLAKSLAFFHQLAAEGELPAVGIEAQSGFPGEHDQDEHMLDVFSEQGQAAEHAQDDLLSAFTSAAQSVDGDDIGMGTGAGVSSQEDKSIGDWAEVQLQNVQLPSSPVTEDGHGATRLPPDTGAQPPRKKKRKSGRRGVKNGELTPWLCTECGQRYSRAEFLRRHARTHEKAKPWLCHCGKSFGRSDVLTRHRKQCKEAEPLNHTPGGVGTNKGGRPKGQSCAQLPASSNRDVALAQQPQVQMQEFPSSQPMYLHSTQAAHLLAEAQGTETGAAVTAAAASAPSQQDFWDVIETSIAQHTAELARKAQDKVAAAPDQGVEAEPRPGPTPTALEDMHGLVKDDKKGSSEGRALADDTAALAAAVSHASQRDGVYAILDFTHDAASDNSGCIAHAQAHAHEASSHIDSAQGASRVTPADTEGPANVIGGGSASSLTAGVSAYANAFSNERSRSPVADVAIAAAWSPLRSAKSIVSSDPALADWTLAGHAGAAPLDMSHARSLGGDNKGNEAPQDSLQRPEARGHIGEVEATEANDHAEVASESSGEVAELGAGERLREEAQRRGCQLEEAGRLRSGEAQQQQPPPSQSHSQVQTSVVDVSIGGPAARISADQQQHERDWTTVTWDAPTLNAC
ncbi:hypothetical protein K437DRAFT_274173 [Tilletiaria anomala UBC 951]|uniref:C2H2-type domain-containing protein n=1 Tax=Tilletiaria anomala (strain ATCC 24038 / CBS 436.72 / UBC 951) TaxID=1037660 RepID=A0A066VZ70_TILAU|nr:uncharacterized protein K437DRAFT_274173 [Tilletiaria anomala UBC 951]KDN45588.1 hypothetical protein K437DRAFT_274173 [Tilletiaria anomala UBC 951]